MSFSDSASGVGGPGGDGPLNPADLELLAGLGRANEWTRSLLCTLARRGTWLRQSEPERARALLAAVAAWPWYKAGQFFFDLLEWEDFMVDGPAPADFAGAVDDVALKRLVRLLRLLAFQLDGSLSEWQEDSSGQAGAAAVAAEHLPALEPGYYLYQDVVLGVLLSFSSRRATNAEDPRTE